MKPKLLCILGETCSGKDSIIAGAMKKLSKYDIKMICSYTDRSIRMNETDGVEHYFVDTTTFNELKAKRENDILAYTLIKDPRNPNSDGYQYMALNDELGRAHLYIIDYDGLRDLKKRYGDSVELITVYIHAPFKHRMQRAETTRSDFNTEFKKRVQAEEVQFEDFRKLRLYDYKIDNYDGRLEKSIGKLSSIIEYEFINQGIIGLKNK